MDLILIVAFFSVILLIILGMVLFLYRPADVETGTRRRTGSKDQAEEERPRRAQIVRNQRTRLRVHGRHEELEEENDSNNEQTDVGDEKIGAKKRAKLEAKAEKKALRELEEKTREDKKKRDQLVEEERQKSVENSKTEERRLEEQERLLREEQEQRDHEEYLRMKAAFSVVEEGYEGNEEDENKLSLQNFVSYIKQNKVIVIEDVAAMFKLKTQAAIDRIQDLQKDNIISGVIDDRGKYIYISQDELEMFAKFIKQRGRVSLSELAESSNKLINLQPNQVAAVGN